MFSITYSKNPLKYVIMINNLLILINSICKKFFTICITKNYFLNSYSVNVTASIDRKNFMFTQFTL